ncbi:MAG: hypothetical protein M3H12_13175 [Chromatiales bacterium]|nr:hypothetical protein [Gammaproteobacteria bacterium]
MWLRLPNGKDKAILKKEGKTLKPKSHPKKTYACQWARRMEAEQEALLALGLPGTRINVRELAKECRGGDKRVSKLGPIKFQAMSLGHNQVERRNDKKD